MLVTLIITFLAFSLISFLAAELGWSNLTLQSRNDTVFEDKNRKYGAYSIRNAYNKHLLAAFGIMGLLVMAFISGNLFWKNVHPVSASVNIPSDRPIMTDVFFPEIDVPIIQTSQNTILKTTPPSTEQFTTPLVVAKIEPVNIVSQDILKITSVGLTTNKSDNKGSSGGDLAGTVGTNLNVNKVWDSPEVNASFPDGTEALFRYLSQNIRYPELEKDNGIQGTVFVSFIVSSSGEIKDIKELRGVKGGQGLSKEAIRVISSMPKWKPGSMGGVPVNVRFNLPVKFVLR